MRPELQKKVEQSMRFKDGIAVKIIIYSGCLADKTIYYRYDMPMRIVEKWKWYFEYLSARVKCANPRRKVELVMASQENCLCGADYVGEKTKSLLRARTIKLKKLQTGRVEDDLFGFGRDEQIAKEESVKREIEALERGEFNYYVPPTYINEIKKYIIPTVPNTALPNGEVAQRGLK